MPNQSSRPTTKKTRAKPDESSPERPEQPEPSIATPRRSSKARSWTSTLNLKEATGTGTLIGAIQTALYPYPITKAVLSSIAPFVVAIGIHVLEFQTDRIIANMKNKEKEKRFKEELATWQRRINEVETLVKVAKADQRTSAAEIDELETGLAKIKVHAAKGATEYVFTGVTLGFSQLSQGSSTG
jgi:hypothetical protein